MAPLFLTSERWCLVKQYYWKLEMFPISIFFNHVPCYMLFLSCLLGRGSAQLNLHLMSSHSWHRSPVSWWPLLTHYAPSINISQICHSVYNRHKIFQDCRFNDWLSVHVIHSFIWKIVVAQFNLEGIELEFGKAQYSNSQPSCIHRKLM